MTKTQTDWGNPKRNVKAKEVGSTPSLSGGDERRPTGGASRKAQLEFPFFDACLSKGSNNNAGNNYEME